MPKQTWEIHRVNAIEFNLGVEILASPEHERWGSAYQLAHVSLELIMKAAVYKAGIDKPPTFG